MNTKIIKFFMITLFLLLFAGCNVNEDQGIGVDNSNDDSISSISTATPSDKYPHTKPILIQEAKFEYIVDNGQVQENQNGTDIKKYQNNDTPNDQHNPRHQAEETEDVDPNKLDQGENMAPTKQEDTKAPATKQQPSKKEAAPTNGISEFENRVIQLTNAERRKNGLPNLQADKPLSSVAREKSVDMQSNNYFSHTSPTYGSPFDMMRDFGINYSAAGENIAKGQRTPEKVVESWMNSEGHRKNILSGNFTHIGVGYAKEGSYWTQMFIKK